METRFAEVPSIEVKTDTCTLCGLCIKVCPVRVFGLAKENSITGIYTNHTEECVLCGQCLCVCASGSIGHSGFDKQNFKPVNKLRVIDPDEAFVFLAGRRSVRNYKRNLPPRELIEKVAMIAGFAPGSPHHRIGWDRNITVVYGEENMKIVLDMTAEYMGRLVKILKSNFLKLAARFSDSAKAGLAVIPDMEMRLKEYERGVDLIVYSAPAALFFHAPVASSTPQTDCDTAALLVQLYAEANGLGSCWNGLIQGAASGDHIKGFKKLSEFLNIPSAHKCYAAMTLGYSSLRLQMLPERKVNIILPQNLSRTV